MPAALSTGAGLAIAGGASAGAGILSGILGSGAASKAAAQQAAAQQNAMAFEAQILKNNMQLMAPFINTGYAANNRVNQIFGLGGGAPASAPAAAPAAGAAAPGAVPAPAAAGAGALAATGFTPSGSLPAGYSVQQVGGGEGEGPQRKVVTDSTGRIVSELPGVSLADDPASAAIANSAAISALTSQGLIAQPAATPAAASAAGDATGTAAVPASTTTAGALAGPGSAVTPYAPPNNGVFDPVGGDLIGGFTFNPTVADLENTPGYQFMLAQGLKATQSNAAARGLGMSGAAIKEAGQYATGLADANWKDVFGAELQKYATNRDTFAQNWDRQRQQFGTNLDASLGLNQQFYNANVAPILSLSNQGQAAVANTANQGLASSGQISNALTGIGNANAAGTVGSANALTSGLTGATSSLQNYVLMNKLFGNSGGANPQIGGTSDVGTGDAASVLAGLRSQYIA